MDLPSTPKVRNQRRKFISPASASPYRSPLIHRSVKSNLLADDSIPLDELKASTVELWEKNKKIEEKILDLEKKGCKEEQLKWYIDKLHEYNEIKDAAQTIMGRIAILDQVTVKKVHEDFGMTDKD